MLDKASNTEGLPVKNPRKTPLSNDETLAQNVLEIFIIGSSPKLAFKSLPVIDLLPVTECGIIPGDKRVTTVVSDIDWAARNVGFFYVANHGIPQQLSDHVLQLAQLPLTEKDKINIRKSKCYRGYQKLGQNITQGKRDWHEAIDFFREEESWTKYNPKFPLHGMNQWPENPSNLRAVYSEYIEEMQKLGNTILTLFALALGLEKDFFVPFTNKPFWIFRMIGYPPFDTASTANLTNNNEVSQRYGGSSNVSTDYPIGVSGGTHCDYGCLTIINQTPGITALQAQNVSGEWVNADPIPGTFVVNIGDMLSYWTNNHYKSTPHRILNNSSKYRVSVPFFFEPNYDSLITPITNNKTQLLNNDQTQSIVYGEYLVKKITNNFDFKEN